MLAQAACRACAEQQLHRQRRWASPSPSSPSRRALLTAPSKAQSLPWYKDYAASSALDCLGHSDGVPRQRSAAPPGFGAAGPSSLHLESPLNVFMVYTGYIPGIYTR